VNGGGGVDAAAPAEVAGFAGRVVRWQRAHGRSDLPWQNTRDPYRVWLSEIMLQQTQVATVRGYYARFLARFPTVAELAAASSEDVLALWSGLGYYARARHLHRCAQAVVQRHGGRFPQTAAALATLPGIGRSTAAAIAAFCFGERVAILDGNVKRVLARVTACDADLAQAAGERRLWSLAEARLPTAADGPGAIEAYTQGLMDLGATVCLARAPACEACPVAAGCLARAAGDPERYPVKTRKVKRSQWASALLWATHRDRVWLVQRPATGVWAQLWTLPDFASADALAAAAADWPGTLEWLPAFTHVLTHADWRLQPARLVLPARLPAAAQRAIARATAATPEGGRWVAVADLPALGLPAPIRKLLAATATLNVRGDRARDGGSA